MNHSLKNKIANTILSILLSFAMFALPVFTPYVHADREGADHTSSDGDIKTITSADLLEKLGITDVSDAELRYFAENDIEFRYGVPKESGLVSVSVSDDNVTVTAKEWIYAAENGKKIVWKPVTASLENTEKSFAEVSSGSYSATFGGLKKGSIHTVSVGYLAVIMFTGAEVSEIASMPYNAGKAALDEQEKYNAEIEAYNASVKRFEEDSASYAERLSEYNAYLAEYALYEAKLKEYNEYRQKTDEYEKAFKAYEAYVDDVNSYHDRVAVYEADAATYDDRLCAYGEYIAYVAKRDAVSAKMSTINSVFIEKNGDPSVFATIMGNTVSEVISRKSELIAAGASAKDVDNAGDATNALRIYLGEYNSAKSDADKLESYKKNYVLIKTNFSKLYNSLSTLYGNRMVRSALSDKGKLQRYERFVAELGVIYESFKDTAATSPASAVWPDPVPEAEFPPEPVMPVFPSEVKPPVKTWTKEIAEPECPEEIKEPSCPKREDYVNKYPSSPSFSETVRGLMDGISNGSVRKRTVSETSFTVGYTALADAYVPEDGDKADTCIVRFYNGNELCDAVLAEKGSRVAYKGKTPVRDQDAKYNYTFVGWTDINGEKAELSSVKSDIDVYASFKSDLRKYGVIFVSKNRTERVEYEYGAIPDGKGHYTESYTENNATYVFSGWNKEFTPVTGIATYTALYTGNANEYVITFVVRGREYVSKTPHGAYPVCSANIEKEYVENGEKYEFAGWSSEIAPASKDAVYTAVYHKAESKPDHTTDYDGNYCTVTTSDDTVNAADEITEAVKRGIGLVLELGDSAVVIEKEELKELKNASVFSIKKAENGVYDYSMGDMAASVPIKLILPYQAEKSGVNAYFNGVECGCTYREGKVYVMADGSGRITLKDSFTVTVLSSDTGVTELGAFTAEAGEKVAVPFSGVGSLKPNIVSVKDSEGNDIGFSNDDLTFTMPGNDVIVTISFGSKTYSVSFVYKDEILSCTEYKYGDTVSIPPAPQYKGPDPENEKQHYVFVGWDPEVTPVIGDAVYTACFVLEDIEEEYIPGKGFNFILLGAVLLLLIIVLAVSFAIRRMIKRRKRSAER